MMEYTDGKRSPCDKARFPRENGCPAIMQLPVVVSASRRTDIPAFYADWFFHRLKVGYSAWTNPFNGQKIFVSYKRTRFVVFWSKNPLPLLDHLAELSRRNIGCYIHYTLNDYEKENLEPFVPSLEKRIDTFKRLAEVLGPDRVIWRFDPLLLAAALGVDELLERIAVIGDRLKGCTGKLVFSYADIGIYRKVRANLLKNGILFREWSDSEMIGFGRKLSALNQAEGWGYELATCAERIDLSAFGIVHNRCIDEVLLYHFARQDPELKAWLEANSRFSSFPDLFPDRSYYGAEPTGGDAVSGMSSLCRNPQVVFGNEKNSGLRAFCGCFPSKDIGQYGTCPHACLYCYANTSSGQARRNYRRHMAFPFGESIVER